MSVMDTEQGGIGGVSNKENGVGPNKGVEDRHPVSSTRYSNIMSSVVCSQSLVRCKM